MKMSRRTLLKTAAAVTVLPPSYLSGINASETTVQIDVADLESTFQSLGTVFSRAEILLNQLAGIVTCHDESLIDVDSAGPNKRYALERDKLMAKKGLHSITGLASAEENELETLLRRHLAQSFQELLSGGKAFDDMGDVILTHDPRRRAEVLRILKDITTRKIAFYTSEIFRLWENKGGFVDDKVRQRFETEYSLHALMQTEAECLNPRFSEPPNAEFMAERERNYNEMRGDVQRLVAGTRYGSLDIKIADLLTENVSGSLLRLLNIERAREYDRPKYRTWAE